jgi:hypothetical protein
LIRTHHEVGIQIGLIMRTRDPQVPVLPPANWYADPGGRHQYRYFDGTQWTDHVADGGRAGLDPLGLPPPSEQMLVTPPVVAQAEAEPAPVVAGPPSEQTPGLAIDLDRAVVAEAEVETAPAFVTELDVQQDEAPASEAATPHPEPVSAAATPVGDTLGSPAEGPGAPITMLSMDEAVRRCLRGYADFSGRAPRSEYWWFALAVNLALGVAWLAGTLVFGGIVSTPETAAGLGGVPLRAAEPRAGAADPGGRRPPAPRHRPLGCHAAAGAHPRGGSVDPVGVLRDAGYRRAHRYGDPVPPTGPSARLEATLFGALRIPLLYLLAGVATTVLFDLTRSWAEWGSYWGAWALMLLALGAFVAVLVVLRTVVSRIVLWLEVAAASVLLLAPWVPGAAEPWRDWPQLLQAPVMFPPYRLLFGAAGWPCCS